MSKALLPTVDDAGRLCEAVFALLARSTAGGIGALAEATGLSHEAAGRSVTSLAEAGWLDLEPDGRVAGAAGLRWPRDRT